MIGALLLGAADANSAKTYVDDVFSAYTYAGTGANQSINNGIDLAGKGGLVWCKGRGGFSHALTDTVRGASRMLHTDQTAGEQYHAGNDLSWFNSNGFSLSAEWNGGLNANATNYVSWTFRRAPKFFDIVTWVGDGNATKVLSHALAATLGMAVVKAVSAGSSWNVYHNALGVAHTLQLNSWNGDLGDLSFWTGQPTSSTFTVGNGINANGVTYIAYLYAHDPSPDGLIQCGAFTTDSGGQATTSLGWEPQYLLMKDASSSNQYWQIFDAARGFGTSRSANPELFASASNAETINPVAETTSTGFRVVQYASTTYAYMAIHRPNK